MTAAQEPRDALSTPEAVEAVAAVIASDSYRYPDGVVYDNHRAMARRALQAAADAILAAGFTQTPERDDAAARALDEVERRLADAVPGLREPTLHRAWECGTNQALHAVREVRAEHTGATS